MVAACNILILLHLLFSHIVHTSGGGGGGSTNNIISGAKVLRVGSVVGTSINHPTGDPNFSVLESFPSNLEYEKTSPFLLSHEWGKPTKVLGRHAKDPGPPENAGDRHVGWHPHRGFDILSYIKQGRGSHADSLGNAAIVRPGGIQWMRCGSGIEHAEGGGNPQGADKHGFQLWINLPKSRRMNDPEYGTVQPEDIPERLNPSGGLLRFLVAGDNGAAFKDRKDFSIVDVELSHQNSTQTLEVPLSFTHVIVYAYQGLGKVSGKTVRPQHAAVLLASRDGEHFSGENGGGVNFGADESKDAISSTEGAAAFRDESIIQFESLSPSGAAFLVFMGKPMDEPVSWRGPIVMNTQREIATAYQELRTGNFLKKRAKFDYKSQRPKTGPPRIEL